MKDQIIKILETEGLTPAKFADAIGVQRSSISHILNGRNKPSYDFIMKIIERFHGINADWLLTGKGSMVKSSGYSSIANQQQTTLFDQPIIREDSDEKLPDENKPVQKIPGNEFKAGRETAGRVNKTSNQTIQNDETFRKFTNVNNVNKIVFFYDDGTFEKFISRKP